MRKTVGLLAVALVLVGAIASADAEEGVSPGLTSPMVLPPFKPTGISCSPPPGLTRSLTFVQDNRRDFMEGVGFGLSHAAADRGLAYANALADNDAIRMIEQVKELDAQQAGAIVVAPVDARTLAPRLQALIDQGVYVGAVVPPPAVTILNAPQYLTGETIAKEAARYIEEELGGIAKVVLLTHDSLQFLAPRFRAMRDVLGRLPGVTIVADISPTPVSEDGGYATMKTILIAQPRIDVVLGADTVVLGALRALEETGLARPDQFLGGIDGEPKAVAAIQTQNSPYKATVSLASSIFGYALGQYAADWLEGKIVPQAMDVLPTLLTPDNIIQYKWDIANPAAVWNAAERRVEYLRMYGGICYETRQNYLNFPWSSESR